MSVRYTIIDSHRNMSRKRREDLCDFFEEVKGIGKEDAEQQVVFCDWYESEYAVKWFEVLAKQNSRFRHRQTRTYSRIHQKFQESR